MAGNESVNHSESGGWADELAAYHAALLAETRNSASIEAPLPSADPRMGDAQACLRGLEELRRAAVGVQPSGCANIGDEPGCLKAGLQRHESTLCLGRFTDLGEVGRGGHGVVYRAYDPLLARYVALKVPKPETLASQELRERFLREARAAAALDHPHLVSVYDVGEAGPACYIASQFCSGPTLAAWRRGLTEAIAPRLAAQIVATLAETVEYIHHHGILHRDLKPANVLLEPAECGTEAEGEFPYVLKLADFGLARLNEASEATRTGTAFGTPAYMAPEQAEGRRGDIGAPTDVYALGVMLYELLTGRRPFEGDSDLETLRRVTQGSFASPRSVRPGVPRDLEAVCLTCLEYESRMRYPTAGQLAADLRRFLRCEPVGVRAPGPLRRLAKWTRRKPVTAALTGALAASLALGFAGIWRQWRVAEQHRASAEASLRHAHRAVREFHDALYASDDFDAPEFQPFRDELLQTALKYYGQFLADQGDAADPALRADIADAWYHRAFISNTLGDDSEATRCYERAFALWEALVREQPRVAEHRYHLARTCQHLAQRHLHEFRPADAEPLARRALALSEELFRQYPGESGYRCVVAEGHTCLYSVHKALGRHEAAAESLQQSRGIWDELVSRHQDSFHFRQSLAATVRSIGSLHFSSRQYTAALVALQEARDVQQQVIDDFPSSPHAQRDLARLDYLSGRVLLELDQTQEAHRAFEQARERLCRLAATVPNPDRYREDLADTCCWLARLHLQMDRADEAKALLFESEGIQEELIQEFPEGSRHNWNLAMTCDTLADAYRDEGNSAASLERLTRAGELFANVLRNRPDSAVAAARVSDNWYQQARVLNQLGRTDAARDACQRAIAIRRELADQLAPDDAKHRLLVERYSTWLADLDGVVEETSVRGQPDSGRSQILAATEGESSQSRVDGPPEKPAP